MGQRNPSVGPFPLAPEPRGYPLSQIALVLRVPSLFLSSCSCYFVLYRDPRFRSRNLPFLCFTAPHSLLHLRKPVVVLSLLNS